MKLVTFIEPFYLTERVGLLLSGGGPQLVVDTNRAYRIYLEGEGRANFRHVADSALPPDMRQILENGEESLRAIRDSERFLSGGGLEKVQKQNGERVVFPLEQVRVMPPVPRPGKIIHTAGNFREHAKEGKQAGWEFPIPEWISFLKSPSAMIGPEDNIVHPRHTKELDYEIELAIIMGKRCKYVDKAGAWDAIAGFTIFNDITARDIQRMEMKSGLLNFGKNMDTFAPFGPCLVPRDDIGDVHNLDIECRVNGEVRQKSNTSHLSVKVPEIVSHYSWVTLYPGDIITTGTVSGVAAFRENPEKYYLKPGDVLESEIQNIGVLRNQVVAETNHGAA